MADHRAEQVLAAIAACLAQPGTVPAAATIVRDKSYSYAESELPAVNILMGEEEPRQFLLTDLVNWELTVEIELIAKQTEALATTLNAMRQQVHVALRGPYLHLHLPFMLDCLPASTSKPEEKDADLQIMGCTAAWTVTYRSSLADPSQ